ncbi:MAG: hypothetical protein ACKO2C_08685 [Actinomycetes bacterium]
MNAPSRPHTERGAITMHTVLVTLTVLGIVGVVVVGGALAIAGVTGFGIVILALFGVQAFYGFVLYRRLPRAEARAQERPDA